MRLFGLTLCLLVSAFGSRAESIEDRVASLERQVKTLEEALRMQGGKAMLTDTDDAEARFTAPLAE